MKRVTMLLMIFAFVMIFAVVTVTADTEHLISLQGTASDDQGDPLATGDVAVRIYDAATSGTLIYDSGSDFNGVVQDGVFDVLLGSITPLDLDNTVKYWMEIDVNGNEVVGDAEGGRQEFWPGSGDHMNLQKRVTGTCVGQVMVGINDDGTAICETDDEGTGGIASCTECDASFVNEGQTNSITSAMVVDGTIGTQDIANSTITASDIAANAVAASEIAAGAVGSSEIATGAVTSADIADGQVTSADLFGTNCSDICTDDVGTTDCPSCDSRFVNEVDLDHLDASDGSPVNAVFVDADGDVGIGTTTPASDLSVGGSGMAGAGISGTGDTYGVYGAGNQMGVYGFGVQRGVYGESADFSDTGYGVYGRADGVGGNNHYGGHFIATGATTNYGVYGESDTYGVYGRAKWGLYGESYDISDTGYGAYGVANGVGGNSHYGGYFEASGATTNYGVYGAGNQMGVYGFGVQRGVYGESADFSDTGYGVYGRADGVGGNNHYGGHFIATGATTNYGVYGESDTYGVYGRAKWGLYGESYDISDTGYGAYGVANGVGGNSHYGGYFEASGATTNYGVLGNGSSTGTGVRGEGYNGVHGSGSSAGIRGEGIVGVWGTGTKEGGYFDNFDTTGDDWGVVGKALGSGGDNHYGGKFEASGATNNIGAWASGTQFDFYAGGPGTDYFPFTGSHEVMLSEHFPEDVNVGMIVSVTGEVKARYYNGTVTISSTLPTVELAHIAHDKAVFGVFASESSLPEDHWYESKDDERFAAVNALGEGRVWVSNINGDIQAGDYITTSSISGYGQMQADDLLHSYTLGKAIETVDWNSVNETVDFNGTTHKVYLIAVVYTSG